MTTEDVPVSPGSTDREILRLAVPAVGALVAEPVFLLVDAAIVGHLGRLPLAGLGVAAAALGAMVNLCLFLAYATTSEVARLTGAGDHRRALRRGVDGVWLAAFVGVLFTLAATALAAPAARWLGADGDVLPYAVTYLRVSAPGIPAMLIVLACTGTLRGLQDVRTPLVIAGCGAGINALLNWILVYPVGLGIAGSALGTTLTQAGMAVACLVAVVRGARRHGAAVRPDRHGIRASISLSAGLLVRTLALRVYLLAATAWAGAAGTVALAAHAVLANVWSFLAFALDGLGIAAQAMVGRSLGAADVPGVRASARRLLWWGTGVGTLSGLLVLMVGPSLVPLFTVDPQVREAISSVMVLVALFQPVAGVVFVLDGILIGAGDGRYLAVAGVGATAVFLLAGAAAHAVGSGLVGLWWAVGALMVTRLATLLLRALGDRWLVTGATR